MGVTTKPSTGITISFHAVNKFYGVVIKNTIGLVTKNLGRDLTESTYQSNKFYNYNKFVPASFIFATRMHFMNTEMTTNASLSLALANTLINWLKRTSFRNHN